MTDPPAANMGTRIDSTAATTGFSLSALVADVNGDGKKDIIMEGHTYKGACNATWGADYEFKIMLNNAPGGAQTWSMASINGANGTFFTLTSQPCTFGAGYTVGDLNHDGINDIIIGNGNITPGAASAAGSTYVIWGASNFSGGTYNNGSFDDSNTYKGTAWIRLDGDYANENAGDRVAVGDLDHDGKTDLAIAAPGNTPASNSISGAGSIYVIWGGSGLNAEVTGGAITLETLINR